MVTLFILGGYSFFTIRKGIFIIKLYAVVTLLIEVTGYLYLYSFNRPFEILYNIFSFFEIWVWLYFYFQITQNQKKIMLWITFSAYLLAFLYLGAFNLRAVNYEGILLNNLIVTFLIARYFYYILQKNLDLTGYFIVMAGALFYHSGGFLLNGMIKIIANIDLNAAKRLYSINSILNILFYGFMLWGLISKDREIKISPSKPQTHPV